MTNSDGIHSSAWDEMSLQQVVFISLRELFELQSPSSMTGMSYGHEESASWNGSRILSCMIPVTGDLDAENSYSFRDVTRGMWKG